MNKQLEHARLDAQRKLEEAKYKAETKAINDQIKALNRGNKKKKFTTTKLIVLYLFLMFNAITVYAMVAMYRFMDLSYLGVLITDVAGQLIVFLIYSVKAYKETKEEERVKLELRKLESQESEDSSFETAIDTAIDKIATKLDTTSNDVEYVE